MPATRQATRTASIVAGAAATFARFGFKRAQMLDIAAASGVALGTLYRYSKSKEALFAAALRHAFHEKPAAVAELLAGPPPTRAALAAYVRDFVEGRDFTPRLRASATTAASPGAVAAELDAVIGELYDVMDHYALAICMLDVSAREWPELAGVYHAGVRRLTVELLARYLASRCETGALVATPDARVAAHFVIELCGEFTRGRKYSSRNDRFADDAVARETVLHVARRVFLPHPESTP